MQVSLESEAMASEEPDCDLHLRQANLDLTLSDSDGDLLTLPYSQARPLLIRLSSEAHIQRLRRWAKRQAPATQQSRLEVSNEVSEIGGVLRIAFGVGGAGHGVLLGIDALGAVSILRVLNSESPQGAVGEHSVAVLVGPPAGALDLCLLLLQRQPEGIVPGTEIRSGTGEFPQLVRHLRQSGPLGGLWKRIQVTQREH